MTTSPSQQIRAADDVEARREAVALLAAGELVALPTETVYGLAADACNPQAVAKVFEVKGRPSFNPLIVHCRDRRQASGLAQLDSRALKLAERFWPGPLTLVAPRRPECQVADLVTAGLPTIAVRVPAAGPVPDLVERLGRPLAAPSANRSGRLSATSAEAVAEEFGGAVPLILDAGPSAIGLESTVVAVIPGEPIRLLRPGGIDQADIEDLLGERLAGPGAEIASPGMLSTHYAPEAHLRLDAGVPEAEEAYLAFGPNEPFDHQPMLNLSPAGNLREAAGNLFAYLRRLDRMADRIAVAPIPHAGLGLAINDRLRRAAAPR